MKETTIYKNEFNKTIFFTEDEANNSIKGE